MLCGVENNRAFMQLAMLPACLPDGTADGTAPMQLHLSLVEILFLQCGGVGVFRAMFRLSSSPAAPCPLAGSNSAFSLFWETTYVFSQI